MNQWNRRRKNYQGLRTTHDIRRPHGLELHSGGQPQKERKKDDPADFISCKAFGKTAETMANYLRKGSLIGVTGRIQTGKYDNKEGRTIYTTDVIVNEFEFLESKKSAVDVFSDIEQIDSSDVPF